MLCVNSCQQTSRKTKKTVPGPSNNSSSGEEDEDGVLVSYRSKRTANPDGPSDMGATAITEIETETDRDAQAVFEKALAINKELKGKEDDKVYRGLQNYQQFYEKKDTAQGNASSGNVSHCFSTIL